MTGMMKKKMMLLALIAAIAVFLPAAAADIDPILIDKPSYLVHECGENLFFEVLVDPVIDYVTGGRHAKDRYFVFTAELLFLEDLPWNGIDKGSFVLRHTDGEEEELYPLDYMMTMMMGLKNGWHTISDTLIFGTLLKMTLVFDVKTPDRDGWSLLLQPAERGGSPVCEIEIPLRMQR